MIRQLRSFVTLLTNAFLLLKNQKYGNGAVNESTAYLGMTILAQDLSSLLDSSGKSVQY